MTFLIEYLGIIAIGLTLLVIYNRYKSGWFLKNQTNNQETQETKPKSRFQQWWMQSYIREIYRVRASQRKLACFIPWVGVWISGFFVFLFLIFVMNAILYPQQPLEKLVRYDGVVKDYVYNRKSSDILIIQLLNGEKKYFHALLWIKGENPRKEWIDRNISVWTQREWSILSGNHETAIWKEFDNNSLDISAFKKQFTNRANRAYSNFQNLIRSLTWLFGFLGLLWFINRNPVIK